ncbi:MAG: FecR family protein [Pseudomonadota bacterium]|nr:FecR family protein [Pseudomonadota bacterium]
MSKLLLAIPLAMVVWCLATPAAADDWVAQKLRGEASVFVNGRWVHLKRGDVVATSDVVRTMKDGQVEFIRDKETITLGPNTQIQIFDRTGRRYTTVYEAFGTVRIEANVENVQHFSVQTPFVAATVKGTIFTVVSGKRMTKVAVQRGKVGVADLVHHTHVDVLVGQSASAGRITALHIKGAGKLASVVNAAGQPVAVTNVSNNGNNGNGNGNNGNGNGNVNGNGNGNNGNGNGNNGNGNNGNGNGNGNNGNGNGNGNGNKGNGNGNGNGNKGNGQ